jgi:glycosyltransferase involved in cell wall biosynthesis
MIRITGVFDNSGYGVANKATAMCLINAGIDTTAYIIHTPMSRKEFAKDMDLTEIYKRLSDKQANVNIVQLIPSLWQYGFQKNSKNIGYMFWESDRICDDWLKIINNGPVDEIWVPCQSNYDALMNSGVKKPVYIIPQYTKINIIPKNMAKEILPIPGNQDVYRFYSVFQYINRKNPEALFKAYFNEFSVKDNVQLVVKTYGPSAFSDRRWIKETIQRMKDEVGSTAPIYLFGELLQPVQIDAIHPQCDCYVYTGRGEGHNIPLVESMAHDNQIITTRSGGIVDWISEDTAYVIPHTQIPIDTADQAWGSFYQSNPPQTWGNVKIEDIQKKMRQAYNERNNFSARKIKYKDVLHVCSEVNVVRIIKERLANIL